ncbi:MAG: nucleoside hydrolase [Actinomycetota bacterium]|nr:nucleoside hydrolase [Actinomycetota bacterium]
MTQATPVLLDCDPGHDDAVAILLAAGWDAVDLRAVTTVAGNASLDKVTRNARAVLTLAGLDGVPVAAGAAGPRAGKLLTALDVHGESGLDGAVLPEPTVALDARGAVDLLRDAAPGVLVATGPLTNVAELLERHPGAVEEVVWMGGSTGRGNTRPYAEFNALVDPEAIAVVLAAGVRFTMVGLNLTHQAQATPEVVRRIAAIGTPAAAAVVGWLGFFADTYRELYDVWPPVHDPCALAIAGDPTIARCVDARIDVELEGRHTRGATVVDLHGRTGRPANARVALDLDAPRFWDVVCGAIAAL